MSETRQSIYQDIARGIWEKMINAPDDLFLDTSDEHCAEKMQDVLAQQLQAFAQQLGQEYVLGQQELQTWEVEKILRFFRYMHDMGGGLLKDEKELLVRLQTLTKLGAAKFLLQAVKETASTRYAFLVEAHVIYDGLSFESLAIVKAPSGSEAEKCAYDDRFTWVLHPLNIGVDDQPVDSQQEVIDSMYVRSITELEYRVFQKYVYEIKSWEAGDMAENIADGSIELE